MTSEETLKTLKLMQAQVEWEYPMDYAAAIDEAIEAVYVRDEVMQYRKASSTLVDSILQKAKNRAKHSNSKLYWIKGRGEVKCPVCGHYDAYVDNYCRHCGARMEGIREE